MTELAGRPLESFYRGTGTDYFERRRDPPIEVKRLHHRIEAPGFAVTITDKGRRCGPALVPSHPSPALHFAEGTGSYSGQSRVPAGIGIPDAGRPV